MKKKIQFDVLLDENKLPKNISMNTSDGSKNNNIKALLLSAWDASSKDTLRIDLWAKDMKVNDMHILFHQTILSLATTLERSTGEQKLAGALRDYCDFFAEETKIISR
tara:strand:- start:130 stop:453 length:324 start_codon:yes stop_codon:yes gene_type:complete